jgi:hypothetical protein
LHLTETDNRLLGMIRTIADGIEGGLADGTYLAVSPQFVVTARVWFAASRRAFDFSRAETVGLGLFDDPSNVIV